MPTPPDERTRRDTSPAWLRAARAVYGKSFGDPRNVTEAMDAWGEMDDADRSFVLAHLAYLQIEAAGNLYSILHRTHELIGAGFKGGISALRFIADCVPQELVEAAKRRIARENGEEEEEEGPAPSAAAEDDDGGEELPPGSEELPARVTEADLDRLVGGGGGGGEEEEEERPAKPARRRGPRKPKSE